MKKYRISKNKLIEMLKIVPSIPLNENTETNNEVQNEISDNALISLVLLRDTKQYHQELISKGLLQAGKLTVKGEAALNKNIERLKGLL
jgi:hypothetical protein